MDQREETDKRLQAAAVVKEIDALMDSLTNRYDAAMVLSLMLARSVGLCKLLRESGGGFSREDAITYFGTALAEASVPMVPENDGANTPSAH